MEQRKYFKYKIVQLEELYSGAKDNVAILEELEEELLHRSTRRAKLLLDNVRSDLNTDSVEEIVLDTPNKPQSDSEPASRIPEPEQNGESVIDWGAIMSQSTKRAFEEDDSEQPILTNDPENILDAWTALEALSPQNYKKPNDLVISGGSVAYFENNQEPWIKGEKARPKTQLYYLVYLGCVDLEKATEKLLAIYKDKRIERPSVTGFAALGVVILDRKGIPVPETGLALSSFGWAYARALKGNLHDLKHWEAAEEILKVGLEKLIYKQDQDGNVLPFSFEQARKSFEWLIRNCEIPSEDTNQPTFVIRQYPSFKKGAPDPDILNSFFLNDLQRAKHAVLAGDVNKPLSQYLGIKKLEGSYDLLNDKVHIEKALQPKNMPLGRWPSKGRYPLVLLQQTAVNLAIQEVKNGGLFSVNGPPGTGKTTLLRDIVASVIVDRAEALCAFKNTDDAFEHAGQMKLGNSFVHLYRLHESLRDHEMVVASSNNKAVENISKELPLREQIAEDLSDLNYFKTISDVLNESEEDTWGVIAAVLGNSKNRTAFTQKAWWDDDSGLRNYFFAITGQLDLGIDDNGLEIIPKVVRECDPPENQKQAKQRWEEARVRFSDALKKSHAIKQRAQKAYDFYGSARIIRRKIKDNISKQEQQNSHIRNSQKSKDALDRQLTEINISCSKRQTEKAQSEKQKPGFFKRIFSRAELKVWKESHKVLSAKLKEVLVVQSKVLSQQKMAKDDLEKKLKFFDDLKNEFSLLEKEYQTALAEIKKEEAICGGKLVTPELWSHSHDEQQKFSPNFTSEANRFRDDVFVAAIELHKAFIDVSLKQIRQNLGAFFYCLGNGSLPKDKQTLLPHLWSTAFILTPVISTAFASVGRMLKKLPQDSLGWLLIDESGQATPQAAVGAICRSKRVISVGDPLQIEPVFTLPTSLVEGISKYMSVDPYHWMAPNVSVQTLSDKANSYGTTIPRDLSDIRIGSPLLVHRRCENPMFNISNRMAYNNLMVHATQVQESQATTLFGSQSGWFHIEGSAQEKWSPEEGEFVADMLLRAIEHFGVDTDLFVISPFRVVADRMRQRMRQESHRLEENGIEDPNIWIRDNIGTVHTFQGKEAQVVVLLLGAPDPAQNGARNWATSNVNLLNVAVSRAKQNFYVVGNQKLWGTLGHMKLINQNLKMLTQT